MAIPKGPIAENVRVEWNGARVSAAVRQGAQLALAELGIDLVATAQELVHVDTGLLQSSIVSVPPTGNSLELIFGVFDVPYAFWQEIAPEPVGKPYIRPAVDMNIDKLEALMEESIIGAYDDFDILSTRVGFDQ